MKLSKRQWDDWRCYRCGKWFGSADGVTRQIDSPIGVLTIRVCRACDQPGPAA